ncbi:MAG TPA: twin-arginine translocase TatA/TatE family subunit [Trueperaceae bacterium]
MPRIGPLGIWEILIILVVILLIFGPRRLPEMAKGIGQSVREFRKGIRDMKDDFEAGANEKPAKAQASESRAATVGDSAAKQEKGADDDAKAKVESKTADQSA